MSGTTTDIQKARDAVLDKVFKLEGVADIMANGGFSELKRRLEAAGVASKQLKEGEAAPAAPVEEVPTENEALAAISKMMDEMINGGASLEKAHDDLKGLFESKMADLEKRMAAAEETAGAAAEEAKSLRTENATLKGRLDKAEAALALKPKGFRESESSARIGEQIKQEGQVVKQVTQFGDFTIEE